MTITIVTICKNKPGNGKSERNLAKNTLKRKGNLEFVHVDESIEKITSTISSGKSEFVIFHGLSEQQISPLLTAITRKMNGASPNFIGVGLVKKIMSISTEKQCKTWNEALALL